MHHLPNHQQRALPQWANTFAWSIFHPRKAALLLLILVSWSAYMVSYARIDFSLEELYPQDSPSAVFSGEHRALFGRDDDIIFAIREGNPWHLDLKRVEQTIGQLPGVLQTTSPWSFQTLTSDNPGKPQTAGQPREKLSPVLSGVLIADNQQAGAVIVQLSEAANNHEQRTHIIEQIEHFTEQLGGSWYIGGVPMIRSSYIRLMIDDLSLLLPLATLVSAFFFILSFQDIRHVLLGVLTILLGALLAVGVYSSTGFAFGVFTPAFIAVTLVVGTSDLIHLVHRYSDHHQIHACSHTASVAAAKEVGIACLLTSTTTAVGFFALLATNIPPIRIFGVATGLGVIGVFLISFLIVPPALVWLGPPSKKARNHGQKTAFMLEQIGRWSLRYRSQLLWSWLLIGVSLAGYSTTLKVDHQIFEDIDAIDSVARTQQFMENHMGAILPLQIDIRFQQDARRLEALEAVDRLASKLRKQPQVGHVLSLPDLLQFGWKQLPASEGNLPPTPAAVEQLLLLMSFTGEDPASSLIVRYEGKDQHKRTRISTRVKDAGHAETLKLVENIEQVAHDILTPIGGTAQVTGVAWLAQEVNSTLTRQFASSFAIALGLIGFVWLLITRSLRRSFLALLPNLLPLLILLATMSASGLGLKPSTAMVLSVGLGIAVDDTVHFLAVYERYRLLGHDIEHCILQSYRTAGRSMLDTSLCLGLGFLIFAFSNFGASFNFGMLTGVTIFAALIADLFLLGPLLAIWDYNQGNTSMP